LKTNRTRSPRRCITGALVAAAAIALIAGCTSSGGSSPTSSGTAESRSGNSLTIALWAPVSSLDPTGYTLKQNTIIWSQVYSSLTRIAPNGKIVGNLAESWANPEPTKWIFYLHPNVKFQNGDPLNAGVVKANFERFINSPTAGANGYTALVSSVASVTATNATTLEVDLKAPWVEFPKYLDTINFVDTRVVTSENPTTTVIASGPYKLVSFNPQSEIVLEANPSYFGPPPAYKHVTYLFIPSEEARLAAIKSGAVDITVDIDPVDMSQLADDSALTTGSVQSTRVMFALFNGDKPPFNKLAVREAFNYAIDKSAMTKSIYKGETSPSQGQILTSGYIGFNPQLQEFPYDPAKAKSLLAQAGYPHGFSMTLSIPNGAYVGLNTAAEAIAGQLGEVGINVKVLPIPQATWLQQWAETDPPDDAGITAYQTPDTRTMLSLFTPNELQQHTSDPAYTALVAKTDSAPNKSEFAALIEQAMQAQHNDAQLAYLWPLPLTYAYSKAISVQPQDNENMLRADEIKPAA
jgi:peptide/nickel transport system substrate-binding protein